MGQPYGDPYTTFQVHGSGFVPATRVALSVQGHGTIPPKYDLYVDPKGTFNYTIDQQHIFFPPDGVIPVGTYHVTASDPASGQQATQKFIVDPAPRGSPPPPRPAGSPPPGNGPPPQALASGLRTPSSQMATSTAATTPHGASGGALAYAHGLHPWRLLCPRRLPARRLGQLGPPQVLLP